MANVTAVFIAAIGIAASSLVQAQATRTWVSGVGDDVNPCSRTAPCKTFAGAISKTAAGGEIDVLDPGGYGTLTITKSITIDGGQGSGWASVLDSSVNGFIINAAANDVVTLRNIAVNGAGVTRGINGVRILSAGKVFIENCLFFGHSQWGIDDERTTPSLLFVDNTIVRDNGASGIIVLNSSGASGVEASIRNSRITGNGNAGVVAGSGSRVTLLNSVANGNVSHGVYAEQLTGNTFLFVGDSTFSENSTGVRIGGGSPIVILSGITVTNNDTGMILAGATTYSFGNNRIGGNFAGNGGFGMGSAPLQ